MRNLVLFVLGIAPTLAHAQKPELLEMTLAGELHEVVFHRHDPPYVVTGDASRGSWSSPEAVLETYVAHLRRMESWDDLADVRFSAEGVPAPPPPEAARMARETRKLAEGGVEIHGKLEWRDNTVFVYRFVEGLQSLGGLPFRRIDGRLRLVVDLSISHPLPNLLSKLEWDAPTAAALLAEGHDDPESVAMERVLSGLPIAAGASTGGATPSERSSISRLGAVAIAITLLIGLLTLLQLRRVARAA